MSYPWPTVEAMPPPNDGQGHRSRGGTLYGRLEHIILAMGIKVVQVPGLCVPVALEPQLGVALLNAELDAQEIASALDWVIQEAARTGYEHAS